MVAARWWTKEEKVITRILGSEEEILDVLDRLPDKKQQSDINSKKYFQVQMRTKHFRYTVLPIRLEIPLQTFHLLICFNHFLKIFKQ